MSVLGGIDRRLFQNVDWPLLAAMTGLVILSATTLASLHIGRAGFESCVFCLPPCSIGCATS